MFAGFCDALRSKKDLYTGGAPQLVGMYRKGSARAFGIISEGVPYLGGLRASKHYARAVHEWRNEMFERVDPASRQLFEGAQKHEREVPLR